jgi:hypothetical protein
LKIKLKEVNNNTVYTYGFKQQTTIPAKYYLIGQTPDSNVLSIAEAQLAWQPAWQQFLLSVQPIIKRNSSLKQAGHQKKETSGVLNEI